jgi:hypothetical protein
MSGDAYVGIPSDETFVKALRTEVGLTDAGNITIVSIDTIHTGGMHSHLLIASIIIHVSESKWVNWLCNNQAVYVFGR